MKKRKPSSPDTFNKDDRKRKLDFKRKKEDQVFATKRKPKKFRFDEDDFE
jgi:hypothetical protein